MSLQQWSVWFPKEQLSDINLTEMTPLNLSSDEDRARVILPPDHYDHLAAWSGASSDATDVVVVAAAFDNRPTYFRVDRVSSNDRRPVDVMTYYDWQHFLLELVMIVLALRNLRLGRLDRLSIVRSAAIVVIFSAASWILSANHHVGVAEYAVLSYGCAVTFLYAGRIIVRYCA